MLIKSLVICVCFPSIIIDASEPRISMEKPTLKDATRVGKFFGLFAVPKKPIFPFYHTKNKHWRGAFLFSLGGFPIIATSVEYNHIHSKDPLCYFCFQHPQEINPPVNQIAHHEPEHAGNDGIANVDVLNSQVQYDSLNNPVEFPLNTSIIASATATLSTKPNASTSRTDDALRTLKFKDYEQIATDPDDVQKINDDTDDSSRIKRETQDDGEATTVESGIEETTLLISTTTMKSDENFSTMLELPQKPHLDFQMTTTETILTNYPESKYPSAEFISITQRPIEPYEYAAQIQAPMSFYPSQPDYSYYYRINNLVPYCYANNNQRKFVPSNWFNSANFSPAYK